uniref:E3 ubiquitin-protein ligase E3D n=1 Tax=Branchiostoma floridae TaxID=7739 RepID=C3YI23_BRAFL|eukprot:XP_002604149.1 hypothetical protein BRAFLDRAFT_71559 [Branchiostoma floridae]
MEGKTLFVEIQKQVGAAHFVLPIEAVNVDKSCAKRVLPLPSDGWQEAVAHSFCHKSQDTQNMAAQTLAPRQADILTGTGHVLVHAKAIHSDNVDIVVSKDKMIVVPLVRCKRCRSQAGVGVSTGKKNTSAQEPPEPPGAIKLYLSDITVHAEDSTCSPVAPVSPGQDGILAQQLLKESESQYCLRFVVQDLRADVYLLVSTDK